MKRTICVISALDLEIVWFDGVDAIHREDLIAKVLRSLCIGIADNAANT